MSGLSGAALGSHSAWGKFHQFEHRPSSLHEDAVALMNSGTVSPLTITLSYAKIIGIYTTGTPEPPFIALKAGATMAGQLQA
ncbi:MAG: hypothetical protein D6791_10095 [Chloroflexi bacterium]|nr:MAG: hypothetical protein D6791_10095 [Chloroflexota bacterium]